MKTIIITGATSGLGLALANSLYKTYTLVLVGRSKDKLDTIKVDFGERHSYIQADLTKPDMLTKELKKINLKIDGFVHCAGAEVVAPIKFFSFEKFSESLNLNVYSFIEVVKYIASSKKYSDEYLTSVVTLSSIASDNGGAMQGIYSASKAALEALALPLSRELVKKKIRVNTVKPGLIDNNMTQRWANKVGVEDYTKLELSGPSSQEDVIELLKFLLSDKSKHIVGTSIRIDGGGALTKLG